VKYKSSIGVTPRLQRLLDALERAGATSEVTQLVEELSRNSPEFEALWADNDVRAAGEVPSACVILPSASSNWNIPDSPSMGVRT